MSWSYSVCFANTRQRDAALAFLKASNLQAVAERNGASEGMELVAGNQLLYGPGFKKGLLLGFNCASDHNEWAMTVCAWLACRVEGPQRFGGPSFYKDAQELRLAVGRRLQAYAPAPDMVADERGIPELSKPGVLERLTGTGRTALVNMLEGWSEQWPIEQPMPTSPAKKKAPGMR